ncbi:hypothetical protein [Pseudomonas sp. Gutcm_11s]|uniref:hypothetical protein n=1 Tax=Pseudomonas sp. Gutcm_11s TaxID=3026088 RepID=UPI00235EF550|nr:hypothetical protein [Pseudomonas sp. Gutcm_11s]MDD0841498.1 hypothetical protein [Pseudomonas sp. Gutcm_11s]
MKLTNLLIGTVMLIGSMSAHAASMTIKLNGKYILSSDTRVIAVKDLNCNQDLGQFSLSGNQVIPITICKNESGYGNIQYRNITNNGQWVNSSLLSEGDEVSP